MKKNLLIFLLLTLFVQAKTFTQIEFKGDIDLIQGEFDRATLLKICHIEYPPLYKFWKSDPTFESSQIEGFTEEVTDYAHSMGYYRAKVFAKTTDDTIIITLVKNEPITIASLSVDPEFQRLSTLRKNTRFRTTDFSSSKKRITRHLEENGYPTYTMDAKAYVDLDLYQVKVVISIDKGKKHYFGTTEVNNSTRMDNELITEQIEYKEKELYNVLKLEESYDNIYQLGVFSKIQFQADFNQSQEGVTPITIHLEEGKTKEISAQLGYDTEEGARGGVDYIDHNFFGNLREFRAGAKLATLGYRAYTSIYDPKVIDWGVLGRLSLRNELSYHNWEYDGYDERLLVERVTVGRELFQLDHFFGFQLENNKIVSDNGLLLSGTYLIHSLFYRLVVDKRDDPLDAKNGYYLSLYAEKAMQQIGSDIDYLKLLAEGRYIKAFDPFVLAVKTTVGTLNQETPLFKHFFAGGAMSNRGYEYRDLGTHYEGDPIGGLTLIDSSLEGRYYLTENFSVVSFFDATMLSEEVEKFNDTWYLSLGGGVRYLSVIGPLRFDIGFQEDMNFAIHLGIGQVF
ncbi:MAG TPA: hypothetical protein ENK86_01265 [Campylobacterales bacterium]|nr:hypothetical protein [Campylobacterales bacterium]